MINPATIILPVVLSLSSYGAGISANYYKDTKGEILLLQKEVERERCKVYAMAKAIAELREQLYYE